MSAAMPTSAEKVRFRHPISSGLHQSSTEKGDVSARIRLCSGCTEAFGFCCFRKDTGFCGCFPVEKDSEDNGFRLYVLSSLPDAVCRKAPGIACGTGIHIPHGSRVKHAQNIGVGRCFFQTAAPFVALCPGSRALNKVPGML